MIKSSFLLVVNDCIFVFIEFLNNMQDRLITLSKNIQEKVSKEMEELWWVKNIIQSKK